MCSVGFLWARRGSGLLLVASRGQGGGEWVSGGQPTTAAISGPHQSERALPVGAYKGDRPTGCAAVGSDPLPGMLLPAARLQP